MSYSKITAKTDYSPGKPILFSQQSLQDILESASVALKKCLETVRIFPLSKMYTEGKGGSLHGAVQEKPDQPRRRSIRTLLLLL